MRNCAPPRSCGFQMPAISLMAWAAASAMAMPAKKQKKMFCGLDGNVGRIIGEATVDAVRMSFWLGCHGNRMG